MDSLAAFARGLANRGRPLMVFDWDKAAQLIRERKACHASAGLSGDWGATGGDILRDGKPYSDDYIYLASTWATPELEIDDWRVDCYRMQSDTPGWNEKTSWPQSALDILNGTVKP